VSEESKRAPEQKQEGPRAGGAQEGRGPQELEGKSARGKQECERAGEH